MYKGHFYEKSSNVFVSVTSINWDNKFNIYLPQKTEKQNDFENLYY